jgi:hypothetical protein
MMISLGHKNLRGVDTAHMRERVLSFEALGLYRSRTRAGRARTTSRRAAS